jgi:hypothetical protein
VDAIKPLDQLLTQDSRMEAVWVNHKTGERTPFTLADHHAGVAAETLHNAVPGHIREHFATAQNLLLYSWFVYRFISVAQLHLYSCLEFAIRDKLGLDDEEKPPALRRLFALAKERELFRGATFRDRHLATHPRLKSGEPTMDDGDWFLWLIADYIAYFRNTLAHGSITLMPDGGRALRLVADAVNHLYQPTPELSRPIAQ